MNFFFRHLMKKSLQQANKRNKQVRVFWSSNEHSFPELLDDHRDDLWKVLLPCLFFLAWLKSLSWDYNFTVVLFLLRYWRQITVVSLIFMCVPSFTNKTYACKKVNVRIEPVSARSRTGIWRSIVDNFLNDHNDNFLNCFVRW